MSDAAHEGDPNESEPQESRFLSRIPYPVDRAPVLILAVVLASLLLLFAQRVQGIAALFVLPLNLGIVYGAFRRARRYPAEGRSWRLFAANILVSMGMNLVVALGPRYPHPIGVSDLIFVSLCLMSGLLWAAAIVSLPLRRAAESERRLAMLGSLIFALSLSLVFWVTGYWLRDWGARNADALWRVGHTARMAILGGSLSHALAVRPARFRGPLGWLFGYFLASVLAVATIAPSLIDSLSAVHRGTTFILVAMALACALCAVWSSGDSEPAAEDDGATSHWSFRFLLELPFVGAATALSISVLRGDQMQVLPLLAFVALSGLVVYRQALLMRRVADQNASLERKVLERTVSLERAQSALLRTERMNQLALAGAGAAHDLNNLLTGLIGSVELMRLDHSEGRPPDSGHLDMAVQSASRAGELTQQLMAFARRDRMADVRSKDAHEVFQTTCAILRFLLPKGIALHTDARGLTRPFPADESLIEQVLMNLVMNAKDALGQHGNVTVRAAEATAAEQVDSDRTLLLEVRDDGPGMSEQVLSRLFEPFFTTKAAGRGTGLGLASIRARLDQAGGSIRVESEPGRGSAFYVKIPPLGPARRKGRAPEVVD